jgi:outer membrane protein
MKKIILTVAAVFAMTFANAQEKEAKGFGFSEGNVFLEGNLSYSSTNDKNSEVKTSNLSFNPKVGYFISDKFAVGINLGIGSGKTTEPNEDDIKTSNFNVGAFGRYYFLDLGERFKTYTEFGFDITSNKQGDEDYQKSNGLSVGAGLGMNYFVTPKMAISFGLSNVLSYQSSKTKADGDDGQSSFGANVNVFKNFFDTPTFGLLYKLN